MINKKRETVHAPVVLPHSLSYLSSDARDSLRTLDIECFIKRDGPRAAIPLHPLSSQPSALAWSAFCLSQVPHPLKEFLQIMVIRSLSLSDSLSHSE